MKKTVILLTGMLFTASCINNNRSDAYGNFEAKETIISAETNGKILSLKIEDGQILTEGEVAGLIDTVPLSLKKDQLLAQKKVLATKYINITARVDVLKEKKKTLLNEKERLDKLLEDGAATAQQMDKINGELNVIDKEMVSIKTTNSSVFNELEVMSKQIEQVQDQINRCVIVNPLHGTVLDKYVEPFEMALMGKPLYKITDLSEMYLRVYISGAQLPHITIGQNVEVLIDENIDENRLLEGTVSWISEQAEFTPKIIQTKKERVNLVYAVKILVKNDGSLKIGMPGEVNF
ncbi:MAG: HlyD family efflux transporter periplasmic adaptor subunit [Bacteroidota bacterium]